MSVPADNFYIQPTKASLPVNRFQFLKFLPLQFPVNGARNNATLYLLWSQPDESIAEYLVGFEKDEAALRLFQKALLPIFSFLPYYLKYPQLTICRLTYFFKRLQLKQIWLKLYKRAINKRLFAGFFQVMEDI
ncbi:MAG: hypothetical protein A3G49_00635 [Candidatus Sungbacteria bacterium RIFCSPLOWO2_12_FULL_41_11]|uniref:Uncharacterized protein n=1 Tax=Candidatus Sungbacteria bacterium RIFCSPLOWO2_12_FULL_41_11 TaxID=1802286 RepID=A0A1G2LMZ2_9BACT|nr:MAG: hypothetical protein A3G49_00635 [Candidatus Sungbacteria bacterium RIFCSPLOWO2_12_FULL_41_11]